MVTSKVQARMIDVNGSATRMTTHDGMKRAARTKISHMPVASEMICVISPSQPPEVMSWTRLAEVDKLVEDRSQCPV